jgi:peptidoglycan hydrolase-like protein with peptidoglycan-binding domain
MTYAQLAAFESQIPRWDPVAPEAAVGAAPKTVKETVPPDPTVMAVQIALTMTNKPAYNPKEINGVIGPGTIAAVIAYQTANKASLTVNGNPKDPDLIKKLGLPAAELTKSTDD